MASSVIAEGWGKAVKVFVVEAVGMEWASAVYVCSTRKQAETAIAAMRAHRAKAPEVDWDNADTDLVHSQMNRRERYARRGPGGQDAFMADDFRINKVPGVGAVSVR